MSYQDSRTRSQKPTPWALICSITFHVIMVALIAAMTMLHPSSPLSLAGDRDGERVTVSLASAPGKVFSGGGGGSPARATAPPKPEPTPKAPEKKSDAPPQPEEAKPTATPAPTPRATPVPTQKAEPAKPKETPKPTATPAPTPAKKEEKKEAPKATPKPAEKKPTEKKPTAKAAPKAPTPTPFVMTRDLSSRLRERVSGDAPKYGVNTSAKTERAGSGSTAKASNSASKTGGGPGKGKGPSTGPVVSDDGSTVMKGYGLPDYYAQQALEKLSRNFRVPPEKFADKKAVVAFRIGSDGVISRIRIVKSAGSSELDDYAVQAAEAAARFAALPDDFEESFVDVEVTFSFSTAAAG